MATTDLTMEPSSLSPPQLSLPVPAYSQPPLFQGHPILYGLPNHLRTGPLLPGRLDRNPVLRLDAGKGDARMGESEYVGPITRSLWSSTERPLLCSKIVDSLDNMTFREMFGMNNPIDPSSDWDVYTINQRSLNGEPQEAVYDCDWV